MTTLPTDRKIRYAEHPTRACCPLQSRGIVAGVVALRWILTLASATRGWLHRTAHNAHEASNPSQSASWTHYILYERYQHREHQAPGHITTFYILRQRARFGRTTSRTGSPAHYAPHSNGDTSPDVEGNKRNADHGYNDQSAPDPFHLETGGDIRGRAGGKGPS